MRNPIYLTCISTATTGKLHLPLCLQKISYHRSQTQAPSTSSAKSRAPKSQAWRLTQRYDGTYLRREELLLAAYRWSLAFFPQILGKEMFLLHINPAPSLLDTTDWEQPAQDQHLGPNPLRNPVLFPQGDNLSGGIHRMISIIDIGLLSETKLLSQYQYLNPLTFLTVQQSP